MKCPNCNAKLERVVVISECWQYAYIDKQGKIEEYDVIEDMGDTKSIICPDCDLIITSLIKELP